MRLARARTQIVFASVLVCAACVAQPAPEATATKKSSALPELEDPPRGPFGFSMVATEDGKPTNIESYVPSEECAECHERQWEELKGLMHSAKTSKRKTPTKKSDSLNRYRICASVST